MIVLHIIVEDITVTRADTVTVAGLGETTAVPPVSVLAVRLIRPVGAAALSDQVWGGVTSHQALPLLPGLWGLSSSPSLPYAPCHLSIAPHGPSFVVQMIALYT